MVYVTLLFFLCWSTGSVVQDPSVPVVHDRVGSVLLSVTKFTVTPDNDPWLAS